MVVIPNCQFHITHFPSFQYLGAFFSQYFPLLKSKFRICPRLTISAADSAVKVSDTRCNKPNNFRYEEDAGEVLFYVEIVIMTQFSIEYVLRIWSAGCRGRYEGIRGRLRYALEFFPLLDLVVVTAGIILFIFGWSDSRGLSASSALRSLR